MIDGFYFGLGLCLAFFIAGLLGYGILIPAIIYLDAKHEEKRRVNAQLDRIKVEYPPKPSSQHPWYERYKRGR